MDQRQIRTLMAVCSSIDYYTTVAHTYQPQETTATTKPQNAVELFLVFISVVDGRKTTSYTPHLTEAYPTANLNYQAIPMPPAAERELVCYFAIFVSHFY